MIRKYRHIEKVHLGFCQNALFHNNYFMIYRKREFSPSAFEKSFTAFVIRKDEYQKRTRGGCFRFISLRSGIARRTLFCTASQSISISAQVAISRRSSLMRAVSACICSERSAWAFYALDTVECLTPRRKVVIFGLQVLLTSQKFVKCCNSMLP